MKKLFVLFIVLISLTSCATTNIINDSYQDFNIETDPSDFEYLSPDKKPNLIITDNIEATLLETISNHYWPIGCNKFYGPKLEDFKLISNKARELKACIVLFEQKYQKTLTYQDGAYSVYGGSTHTSHYDIYDYQVYYLVKIAKKIKLGLFYEDLTEQQRTEIQKNYGVYVNVVYKNTPAYYANIIRGDIVLKINDKLVYDSNQFRNEIEKLNTDCTLTILRNGTEQTIKVENIN